MHDGAPRMNGGIGFAIEGPEARLDFIPSSDLLLTDARLVPMTQSEVEQLGSFLHYFCSDRHLPTMARIEISGGIRTHYGMGSGTSLRLAAIEGLALLNGIELTQAEIVMASKRGGTSGVGINTYFEGGLICDLGRPNEGNDFSPSSTARVGQRPLTLPKIALPEWTMLLCIPRTIAAKTHSEEVEFFLRTTPLHGEASFQASYIALFGIYAAAAEADYSAFCRGVNDIQKTTWKQAERSEYGEPLAAICKALLNGGADCAGMSSLGPLLFCFAPSTRLDELEQIAVQHSCDVVRTVPTNRGRDVQLNHA